MKKSIVISLLTVVTLFCTALCSFASTGIVTADTLKVREEPSTESEVIEYLSANDKVEILEESNGWCKVQIEDKVGYVATQYINILTNTDTNPNNENLNEDETASNESNEENNQNEENSTEPEQNVEPQEGGKTVPVLASGEEIYVTPVINSLVMTTLSEEKQIEVVSEVKGWTYVKIGTTSGWVRTENIQQKEADASVSENNNSSQKTVYISGSSVNFRKTPSTSGEIINTLPRNTKVTLITKDESWSEIEFNGDKGYVVTEYISETALETTTRSSSRRTAQSTTTKKANTQPTQPVVVDTPYIPSGNVSGAEVVAYAKQFLGCRYVYGGSSPSGFDCSGFTSYVYKHFGISLNRSSGAQASNGYRVNSNELQLGDILCFARTSGSSTVGHVGIYIGGGQFIHAGNSGTGVIISNVWGAGYYFVTARRVI